MLVSDSKWWLVIIMVIIMQIECVLQAQGTTGIWDLRKNTPNLKGFFFVFFFFKKKLSFFCNAVTWATCMWKQSQLQLSKLARRLLWVIWLLWGAGGIVACWLGSFFLLLPQLFNLNFLFLHFFFLCVQRMDGGSAQMVQDLGPQRSSLGIWEEMKD